MSVGLVADAVLAETLTCLYYRNISNYHAEVWNGGGGSKFGREDYDVLFS